MIKPYESKMAAVFYLCGTILLVVWIYVFQFIRKHLGLINIMMAVTIQENNHFLAQEC